MAAHKLCIDIVGDLPIHDIDDDVALKYAETLRKLPPNINKMPQYRSRTISEIVALNPVPISTRTIDKNIERVSSLFKFATKKSKYALKYNPFEGRRHEGKLMQTQIYWNVKDPVKCQRIVEQFRQPPEIWRLIPKFENVTITGDDH